MPQMPGLPETIPEDAGWRAHAECWGEDPELWFSLVPREQHLAKKICHECPVEEQCRTWAMENGQDFGIWGGMGDWERRNIRAKQKRAEKQATK